MTDILAEFPLVAILRGVTPDRIEKVAGAIFEAGIRAIEVPLNSPDPYKSIEILATKFTEAMTGAGTVTSPDEVDRVANAGGKLAVSPHTDAAVIAHAVKKGLHPMPGVMTPSEVMRARDHGFGLMKLFPAAQAGGVAMLKALSGPLGDVQFCPTGGVTPENMTDYFNLSNVAMVGGSWLTPADAMAAQDWGRITALAKEALARVPALQ